MSEKQSPQRKLTMDDLDRLLAMPLPAGAEPGPPEQPEMPDDRPYLDAAAVVSAFDPLRLVAGLSGPAGAERTALIDRLIACSEPVSDGPQSSLWSLALPERRQAMGRMATRENMRQVLAACPERANMPVDRMFARVLEGEPLDLNSLAREELAGLVTVVDWTAGILEDLPDKTVLRAAIDRCDLLAPMRRLAGSLFVDRVAELEQLGQYAFDGKPAQPLFVFGPGGVGKSTLLSRFILRAVEEQDARFIYIDIDRPTIRPDRLNTLLVEVVKQLQKQLEISASAIDPLIKEIMGSARRFEGKRAFESFNVGIEDSYFFDLLKPFVDGGPVVIVIIDTFEEAQFLGPDVVYPLVDFLFSFADTFQQVRLILSGRALPGEYATRAYAGYTGGLAEEQNLAGWPLPGRPINLGILDEAPARELLQAALAAAGIAPLSDEELVEVIGIVGRNPMCLKLAARLIKEEGIDKLRAAPSQLLARLKAEKIQAHLYGRILHHLHDQDVRKVAYPGLIVRRITPQIIREVLAKPCQLVLEPWAEERIFNDLAREAALVEWDPADSSLRHRTDVRRAMLQDLSDHVPPEVVKQIDRAAVAYYARQEGAVARAEEIYHRLRLRQTARTLEKYWRPEAAAYLKKGTIEELDAQQRLWLAKKLDITLDDSVRRAAGQEAWEDQAARTCARYLQVGMARKALEVLHERPDRLPRSGLYELEAEACRILGSFDEALRVSAAGVAALVRAGSVDQALELQLKMVVIEETRQNLEAAEDLLEEAAALAENSSNALLRLRVQVTRLRLQRQLRPDGHAEQAALRKEALASLSDELLVALRAHPVLLRETAAELGKEDARISRVALETLGLEVTTDDQAEALAQAIRALLTEDYGMMSSPGWARELLEKKFADAGTIRKWVTTTASSADTRQLARVLGTSQVSGRAARDFRSYFRAGVESTLRFSGKSMDDKLAR